MPFTSGTRLGPYEIVSPLGAGGMGEVYVARDTRLERTVAVNQGVSYLVVPDGKRILISTSTDVGRPITLLQNWTAALRP